MTITGMAGAPKCRNAAQMKHAESVRALEFLILNQCRHSRFRVAVTPKELSFAATEIRDMPGALEKVTGTGIN
jgi:hypothetical protein